MQQIHKEVERATTHAVLRPAVSLLVLAVLWVFGNAPASAQSEVVQPADLTITSISIEPSDPGADTLCKLRIAIQNAGKETASQLAFRVEINGVDITVYGNQLFMYPLPAGKTTDIALYNFWTNEPARPMPADGKLQIEVSLTEAQWMQISMEDEVEVWQPLGPVNGLPINREISVSLEK